MNVTSPNKSNLSFSGCRYYIVPKGYAGRELISQLYEISDDLKKEDAAGKRRLEYIVFPQKNETEKAKVMIFDEKDAKEFSVMTPEDQSKYAQEKIKNLSYLPPGNKYAPLHYMYRFKVINGERVYNSMVRELTQNHVDCIKEGTTLNEFV